MTGSARRRTVLVTITDGGVALLRRIAEPLKKCHDRQLGHLSKTELKQLEHLLLKARLPHESDGSAWK